MSLHCDFDRLKLQHLAPSLPRVFAGEGGLALRGRVGGTQRLVDKRQHALQIAIDFIVPEAQYSETFARQATVTLRIAPDMRIEIVLTAIDLDDEPVSETDEVYDRAIARRLASEMEPLFSPCAQMNPQFDFLRGHAFSK